jgi:signal transduction histidine kinase
VGLLELDSGDMTAASEQSIRRLLAVGRALTTELDQRTVLDRVLEEARNITGARYAALGILNEQQSGLEQFLTAGIDEAGRRAIGDLPRGRGVLGKLIEDPRPLRLADVGQDPSSYGFPAGHPAMRSFLGVPIAIRGEVWGNLYLTEKSEGEFTEADEEAAVILADWAAIAIGNARLYESSERRREEAEQAFRGLQATSDIAVAIGGEIALEHVLELIAKRGRALVSARSLVIMLREGEELVVHASAGHVEEMLGVRLSIAESTSGRVLEHRQPERIADVASRLRIDPREFGVSDSQTALLVPLLYRGEAMGVLAAFDRGSNCEAFTEDDEQLLRTFAASAATAVALAQSVQADRLRSSMAAADAERQRWARELHDETLQGLGALQVLLSSALRRGDSQRRGQAMHDAVEQIKDEIENLRTIITELRPAALDELGLETALEALLERHREQSGLEVEADLSLAASVTGKTRQYPELESTAYRLVQEALTNVVKHSRAETVRVTVREAGGQLLIEVRDDGAGFDLEAVSRGFGLAGMRERARLAGGTLSIDSDQRGTLVRASLTVPARPINRAAM